MAERHPWGFKSFQDCTEYHSPNIYSPGYCNATWDNYLCWPMTLAKTLAVLPCPQNLKGILKDQYASRRCSEDGFWIDYEGNESYDVGWTNFTSCFDPRLYEILKTQGNKTEEELEFQKNTLQYARILEMVGYSISFASVLASLIIISAFRSLKSKEKRIHRQLYLAMFIQIVIRLILYTDQYILRKGTNIGGSGSSSSSSDATDDGGGTGGNDTSNGETKSIRGIDNTVKRFSFAF